MTDDTLLPFDLPAVRRKKLTIDFNGGTQSSDAGLLLLREAERKLGRTFWCQNVWACCVKLCHKSLSSGR